jgi:tRNA(adenine34) deaminase
MRWTSCAAADLSLTEAYPRWMGLALDEARLALVTSDVPVGAVVVDPAGLVIGVGRNAREAVQDPTAHAEVLALRAASAELGSWRLTGHTLIVTLEPCTMCAGAVIAARVPRLVFGAADERAGAAGSFWDLLHDRRLGPAIEVVGGVLASDCAALLHQFFTSLRNSGSAPGG